MQRCLACWFALAFITAATTVLGDETADPASPRRLNNLTSILAEVAGPDGPGDQIAFTRPEDGWVFVSARLRGEGRVKIVLGGDTTGQPLIDQPAGQHPATAEAMRRVTAGQHQLQIELTAGAIVERLVVQSIPELMHCGLGFDSAIKSYGRYDMEFLKRDILPNVNMLVVPGNIQLPAAVVDAWHAQGKRFIAEVGVSGQAKTADEHWQYWTGVLDKSAFLDGIIINEFIVNMPSGRTDAALSPERQQRREQEQARYQVCEEALRRLRADARYHDKQVFVYFGGSGKRLNQEIIGPTFVRTLIDGNQRIALERYLHEMSSPEKSRDALQTFIEGIADWESTQPGATRNMVIAFGLFSMPPGGINKQPNVDYHVWMDQQMNLVANHPVLANLAGLEWWTSILADEETVRFVGKLYRHYAIEGKTALLTHDPLFLSHVDNADFERGTESWTLEPAEPGSIEPRSFPRYGRIEGRFMGLGRPADPEHIGDTFLWMKRSAKGPNTFSQPIKNLQPGRLYSMKMFSCDYQDLVHPRAKKQEEAQKFIGQVKLEGVEVDAKRSFTEMYPSSPEPTIPVWITYHWTVFRAQGTMARVTVSDWPSAAAAGPFGQEQTFNFLEIQPYHE